jgi:hypothetical protein
MTVAFAVMLAGPALTALAIFASGVPGAGAVLFSAAAGDCASVDEASSLCD